MTATPDLFALLIVIPLTAEVARRAPAAIRNDKSRALWAFLLVLDLAVATRIDFVSRFIQEESLLQTTALAKQILSFAAVALLLKWVSAVVPGRMDGKPEPRYRRVISSRPRKLLTLLIIVASSAMLPLAAKVDEHQRPDEEYIFQQAGHLWGSLHLILFYLYMLFGAVCTSMMLADASRTPKATGAFRIGTRMMSVGCSIAAVYAVLRSGFLTVSLFNKPFLGGETFVGIASDLTLAAFVLLMIAGSSAPAWERMSSRVQMHAALNDLRPMWRILTEAVPTVVYRSPREEWLLHILTTRAPGLSRMTRGSWRMLLDTWNLRGLEGRLRRRVTEICDASMRLADYLPEGARKDAEEVARDLGLPDHTVPAYLLRCAVSLKHTGASRQSHDPTSAILPPLDDALATAAKFLPIGKAMASPVIMGKFHRRQPEHA
ncbi:MAB_1171c family putative transporter [Streptomyces sp. NPDC088752]|uniref:MAB_1171c family putative transporter n=1 Tax=Streptomyces sp. NPDC088752 TaxID=3154963 RepID=UPI0034179E81